MNPEEDPLLQTKLEFSEAFRTTYKEFFGDEKEFQYELYELKSEESGPKGGWATFTIRNPAGGRSIVFRFDPGSGAFYAMLKVQVLPGEEDWSLDSFFERNGFANSNFLDVKRSAGEWLFHSLARHYLGTIFTYCPRILEPDYILE
ncbi:hypothetical protein LEP1GSC047_3694 [Leptospira inadai serovar Lyme str. 10]|uniref:Uncharacterized protein n=2 Tax=Leptospira inadai serovar Lyme TaxID=293084 RepID=V6HJZ8_9LEPT|nr:hypothetical protein [Leptospira inadai]EQA37215.1 hypothetical protein LEP1GSC047_3694 [Leptospira inadai serovar Lyme str. 10]PNV75041.1 hypothetical protein BES34_010760 [Leptospira inadai serovar Lyme]